MKHALTGGSSVGQGIATAMAQICADTLGVDYRRVRIVLGQTDRIQYGIAHSSPDGRTGSANADYLAATIKPYPSCATIRSTASGSKPSRHTLPHEAAKLYLS